MKIVFYSPHPNLYLSAPSGPGTHMREVIAGFEKQGHEVVRCIMGGEQKVHSKNIQYKSNPLKSFIKSIIPSYFWQSLKDNRLMKFDQYAYQELEKIIKSEKPELIYERANYLMDSGVRCAKKYGLKHILEVNAPYSEEKVNLEGRSFYLKKGDQKERIQLEMSDRLVVVSSALKKYYADKYDKGIEKIKVIPNAVNPEKVKTDSDRILGLKNELSFDESETIIGFVGAILPYHGVDKLVYAFEKLVSQRENIKLLIVGDGGSLLELKEYIADKKLSDKIVFTGNVPHEDVYNYISLMDITVMANSNWYGSPVKIFEYGIMKKAIIAPNNVPVNDVMVHNEDGLLVENNESQLMQALNKLLDNPELRQQYATTFYDKVVNNHTWLKVSESTLKDMQ